MRRAAAGLLLAALLFVVREALAQVSEFAPQPFRLTADGPLLAGSVVGLTISYRPTGPLQAGTRISINPHWRMAVAFQAADPSGHNHVRMDAGDLPVTYDPVSANSFYGGPPGIAELASFVVGEPAPAGRPVSITISNFQLPRVASRRYALEMQVVAEGSALRRFPLPLEISPGPPGNLRVAARSLVKPGGDAGLMARVEDSFGNPVVFAAGEVLSLDLRLDGRFTRRVDLSAPVQGIPGVAFDAEGVYQVELWSAGGGLRGVSNPIVVRGGGRTVRWVMLKEPINPPHSLFNLAEAQAHYSGLVDLLLPSDETGGEVVALPSGWTAREESRDVARGGSLFRVSRAGRELDVLLAENPTDFRLVGNLPALAQIAGGDGAFEWFANRAAARGLVRGFAGIGHSHQRRGPGPLARLVRTAVVMEPGESVFAALSRGSVFANAGDTILLLDRVGGASRRLGLTDERRLAAEIYAASPVSVVELIKNGEVLESFREPPEDDRVLALTLSSASEPLGHRQSLPRNPREWVGYAQVGAGRLSPEPSTMPAMRTRLSPSGRRLDFLARTHGRGETLRFGLTGAADDTVVEVHLAPGHEAAGWLPRDRLPAATPTAAFRFPMAELQSGPVRRVAPAEGYQDGVTLAWANRQGPGVMDVAHTDRSRPRVGDYYYFRVTLDNGSMAWSSPLIVGGGDVPPGFSMNAAR